MDSATNEPVASKPHRGVIACLFIVGVIALGFGLWRLSVWGFGRPEQLLDIGDTRMKLLAESSTEPAKRNVQMARERKDAIDPKLLAAAEEELRLAEERQPELVKAWELQVQRARRDELVYVLMGTVVGAFCLWAGCRQLRVRGQLSWLESPGAC